MKLISPLYKIHENLLLSISAKDERRKVIIPYLSGTVLDVGCGDNELKDKYTNMIGVDKYSDKADAKMDAEDLKFKQCIFDIVVATDVVEHLGYPEKFFKRSYIILKKGGKLVITTPDFNSIGNKIRHLLSDFEPRQNHGNTKHITYFTKKGISKELEEIGFFIEEIKNIGVLYGGLFVVARKNKIGDEK